LKIVTEQNLIKTAYFAKFSILFKADKNSGQNSEDIGKNKQNMIGKNST